MLTCHWRRDCIFNCCCTPQGATDIKMLAMSSLHSSCYKKFPPYCSDPRLHSNSAQCTCSTGVGSTESLTFDWLIIVWLIDHQKQCSHPILLCLSNLTLLDFAVNKYLLKSPLQFTFILCGFNLNFYFSFNFQLALTLNVSKKGFDPCKFNLSFHGSLKMLQRATPPNFTNLVCSKSGVGSLFCSWGEESNNYVRLVNIM